MKPNFTLCILMVLFFNISNAQLHKSPDYETAKSDAQKSNKDIMIVLTGSEWCKPCMKMKKNVFERQEFIDFVTENFVIFEINLDRHWDMNSKVYQDYVYFRDKYQTNALPSIIILDVDENKKLVISEKLTSLEKTLERLKLLQ